MPLPTLFLPILAAAAGVPDNSPVVVTGHQWAPFISPMGEPFRAHSPADDTLADWFTKADRNHDGVLTADELRADAERFFATLDDNHDGQLDPDELANYEYEIAPDIQVMSRTKRIAGQPPPVVKADEDDVKTDRRERRKRDEQFDSSLGLGGDLQGAARYGLLNLPEPVVSADTDFNRAVTLDEFRAAATERFQLLDTTRQGRITLAQLEAMPHAPTPGKHRPKRNDDKPDTRIGNPIPTGP